MADIRTLKLQLLADTAQFQTGLNKAQDDTQNFSSKVGGFVAGAAKAFLALGAAVGTAAFAIGVSAVKAAIEDEKAQASLAQTLRGTVQATDEQIAATEAYIDVTQRATGIADDQLRPSLQRLLISTNDLAEAQKLQALALDIAAGSGKSLEEVSGILGKAYDGNFKALKNLGVELKTTTTSTKTLKVSKSDLAKQELNNESATLRVASAQERLNKVLSNAKSDSLDVQKAQNALEKAQLAAASASDKYTDSIAKQGKTVKVTKEEQVSFDEIVKQLTQSFGGQAAIAAETFAGRMDRIKIAVSEAKESLGAALLPILEKIAGFVNTEVVPAIQGLVDGLTGQKSIRQATIDAGGNVNLLKDDLSDANESGRNLGEALRTLAETIGLVGSGAGTANPEFSKFVDNITKLVQGVNDLFGALQRLGSITGGVIDLIGLQGLLARVESAGERFRGAPTSGGQYGPTVNQTVIFNPLTTKDAAKKTLKSLNDASKTGNIGQFVKPMIPGR
jgi:hypothetical protein